jgi:hypothetical protein
MHVSAVQQPHALASARSSTLLDCIAAQQLADVANRPAALPPAAAAAAPAAGA